MSLHKMKAINKNGGKSQTIDRVHPQSTMSSRISHDISGLDVAEMSTPRRDNSK